MSTVAFIGLGIMGRPMAMRLHHAGHVVCGYNRSPERSAALVAAGGTAADSVAGAVAGADVVAIMVPDTPDVREVLTAPDGVFARADPGVVIIDFSSIRPGTAVELAGQARHRGLRFLDAPVSGGERGAVDGTLSVMVGGAAADFAAVQPLLGAVGRTVAHVGPSGSGQIVKAANQLIVAGTLQLLAEALVLLEAHEVETSAALDVLGGGLAGSRVLDLKGHSMADRSFEPGGRLELHHKDLGNAVEAARDVGAVIPLGALVAELMASAVANGDGGLDHSALLRGVERLSGRTGST